MSIEENILTDCLDWSQPFENWEERTSTEIASEILDKTGHRISPQKVGTNLRNMGYEKDNAHKKWRLLNGRTLYNIPCVVLNQSCNAPFAKKYGNDSTKSGVTNIQGYFR